MAPLRLFIIDGGIDVPPLSRVADNTIEAVSNYSQCHAQLSLW